MIPLQEQERLRQYFGEQLTGGVKIEHVTQRPLAIMVPGRDECRFCTETRQALEELRTLSQKIGLRVQELDISRKAAPGFGAERAPTTVLRGQLNRPVRFEGFFGGVLFPVLVGTIIAASRGATEIDAGLKRRLQRLREPVDLRVFVSPASPYAAAMMQNAFAFGLENHRLHVTVTEAEEFSRLAETYQVRAVPFTVIGERVRFAGAVPPESLVDEILKAPEARTFRLAQGLPVPSLGPATPLQAGAEAHASPSGLILPGR